MLVIIVLCLCLPVSYDVPYLCVVNSEKHVILQTNKEDQCKKIPNVEWFYAIQKRRIAFHIIRLTELVATYQQRNIERLR